MEPGAKLIDDFRETFARIQEQVARVVVGHRDVVEQILVAFFSGGHVLIEGVPGRQDTASHNRQAAWFCLAGSAE